VHTGSNYRSGNRRPVRRTFSRYHPQRRRRAEVGPGHHDCRCGARGRPDVSSEARTVLDGEDGIRHRHRCRSPRRLQVQPRARADVNAPVEHPRRPWPTRSTTLSDSFCSPARAIYRPFGMAWWPFSAITIGAQNRHSARRETVVPTHLVEIPIRRSGAHVRSTPEHGVCRGRDVV